MKSFQDHFSGHAGDYRVYRPLYPAALFELLAEMAPGRDLAWDVGCGNGQFSVGLARHFARVAATDASAEQIARAEPHPKITYRAAPAEAGGLISGSADLIVAAQAAHWFDLPAFYAEVRRVARGPAVLALVSYGVVEAGGEEGGGELTARLRALHDQTLGAYWPPERRFVEEGYRSLPFPFDEETPLAPIPVMEVSWTLDQLVGYIGTWSAVRQAMRDGARPLEVAMAELAEVWGAAPTPRPIRWPLNLRLGRVKAGR